MQHDIAVRHAKINAVLTTIGATPKLQLWSGAVPADCATAPAGTKLAELTLPSTWMGTPSAGVSSLAGSWTGTASAGGTAAFFRIVDSGGTCRLQGSAGTSGAELNLSSTTIANGQTVTISAFTYTEGNA